MLGDRKDLERELSERGGVVAWATVIEAKTRWTSGSNYENGPYTVGNHAHMTVKLRVQPDGEPEFEAKFRQTFAGHLPLTGGRVKVVYDPNDHDKIAVQEDQVFPPGVSPDKALRARAHAEEAQEAVASGHMHEYIERRTAEAMAGASGISAEAIRGERLVISGGDTGKTDIADELSKLAALRDQGLLTEAEFEAQKARLLGDG
jgi:hypothetical protein